MSGRAVIVTGAALGIGVETARALAATRATVTLAVRDIAAGWRVAADIVATTANTAVKVEDLDLADIVSVDNFTHRWQRPLHVLVSNAGVMMPPESHTAPNWELQFATNLAGGGRRYHQLHDALDGISYKILTDTLRPRHWRTCEPAVGPIGCWTASPPSGSDGLTRTAGRSESTEAMVTRSREDHGSDG